MSTKILDVAGNLSFIEETLTDGSKVYDLILHSDQGKALARIKCESYYSMCNLASMINSHVITSIEEI